MNYSTRGKRMTLSIFGKTAGSLSRLLTIRRKPKQITKIAENRKLNFKLDWSVSDGPYRHLHGRCDVVFADARQVHVSSEKGIPGITVNSGFDDGRADTIEINLAELDSSVKTVTIQVYPDRNMGSCEDLQLYSKISIDKTLQFKNVYKHKQFGFDGLKWFLIERNRYGVWEVLSVEGETTARTS